MADNVIQLLALVATGEDRAILLCPLRRKLMPRGRKGPPQESIDSILLAISRRSDNIDPETMSHFFDRLDEEWTCGAREKVLHLLRSSDHQAHATAVLILSELATDFDLEELEDFVTDPTVSDMAKLSLSSVLRELGSEMADDGILEYLNDPVAAIQQMQSHLLELVDQSEIGVESILEDVTSMPFDRRLAFISWLGSSNDPRAANLLIPLLENQSSKDTAMVIDALEQLGPVAVQQTIPALNYVIASSSNREIKQKARATLGRLTMQSMIGTEDVAMAESRQPRLPEYEARCSFIDGSGSQLIMLSWLRPDGSLKGVNVLSQEKWGIKECYGIDEIEKAHWDRLVGELDEQGFGSFHIPFEFGCALITEARALNKRLRHKLPIAYAVWRPFIEGNQPAKKQKSSLAVVESLVLNDEMQELARRGDGLYLLPEFASWLYEPAIKLEPYISRYWSTYGLLESAELEKQAHKRKDKLRDGERQALLETLVSEALCDLITPKWRATYELRLRRQAALLQTVGREQDGMLARAVATLLHPDSPVPVQEQPFLRAMLRLSIEQGPLRMMMEALNSNRSELMPIHLFGKE
jgi:hypothetical protein